MCFRQCSFLLTREKNSKTSNQQERKFKVLRSDHLTFDDLFFLFVYFSPFQNGHKRHIFIINRTCLLERRKYTCAYVINTHARARARVFFRSLSLSLSLSYIRYSFSAVFQNNQKNNLSNFELNIYFYVLS